MNDNDGQAYEYGDIDDVRDAHDALEAAVKHWMRLTARNGSRPHLDEFVAPSGRATLTTTPIPEPAASGEIEVVVYFNPSRNGYFVREYDPGVTMGNGYVAVARVRVRWVKDEGLPL